MKLTSSLQVLVALAVSALSAKAAEKNGLMATVAKKTIERGDSNFGTYTKIDRTQGLALDVKNMSIKSFAEGDVDWTIVVRRGYEGDNAKFTGKEKLKALKPSQQLRVVIGAAQVGGYRSDYANYKDKLEYEVVISHGGKETIRLSSTPSFAVLARNATLISNPEGEGEATAPAKPEGEMPKKVDGGKTAIIKGDGGKPAPATPATPGAKPTPAGEPPKSNAPPTGEPGKTAEEPAAKQFDFFNLGKKKKPEEK